MAEAPHTNKDDTENDNQDAGEVSNRLIRCFELVFPGLSRAEIRSANMASMARWDSVATLNLSSLIDEEFGVQIDDEELGLLISFDLILDYLTEGHNAS